MNNFRNILYVNRLSKLEVDVLKQTISLARNSSAQLKVLVLTPAIPKNMEEIVHKHKEVLIEKMQKNISEVCEELQYDIAKLKLNIDIAEEDAVSALVIRHALREGADLLIKAVEGEGKGFKALDMELIRKCPCPVWLCRPITSSRANIKVAVAVDPNPKTDAGAELNLNLLKLSSALSNTCNGQLEAIAAWDYALEGYLKSNPWFKLTEAEVQEAAKVEEKESLQALKSIVSRSGVDEDRIQTHLLRGKPEDVISNFTVDESVDILVMGTVARTGIAGFIMGNTAENTFQALSCSLLALKPNGFVSPVKAY